MNNLYYCGECSNLSYDDDELMNADKIIYKMCDYYKIPIKNENGTFRDIYYIFKDLSQVIFEGELNEK